MKGKTRNLFPGGNTPEGFYSYYKSILGQNEASCIICLKGGPGVGKSSFMREIGSHFTNKGEDVDYFRCSSDPSSLDGVLIRNRKIAIIDGTSPHIIDPENPGAVDMIINLGDYWDGSVIRQWKDFILDSNYKIKKWFSIAYNNLSAAASIRKSLTDIYKGTLLPGELYREAAGIINKEFSSCEVVMAEGVRKKYFATAVTPDGLLSNIDEIISECRKVYFMTAPVGFETSEILKSISDNAVHRGFYVEEFYCPMNPSHEIEHLYIPQKQMAFVTLNSFHDVEVWDKDVEVHHMEMRDFIDWGSVDVLGDTVSVLERELAGLLSQSVGYLKNAKKEHDILESYYVPNMDFEKINALKSEIIGKIERNVL